MSNASNKKERRQNAGEAAKDTEAKTTVDAEVNDFKEDSAENGSGSASSDLHSAESFEARMQEMQQAIDKAEAELDQQKDQLLRTAAEFDNYKRRSQKEREELVDFIKAGMFKELLPCLDSLEQALSADQESPDYGKGLQMTLNQTIESLHNLGLTEINPVNQPFDPSLHEAIMHEEDGDLPENTVKEVLRKGYQYGDVVIRPAMVKVAN